MTVERPTTAFGAFGSASHCPHMSPSNDPASQVLAVLEGSRRGLTEQEIRRRSALTAQVLRRTLLQFEREGLAAPRGGRWFLTREAESPAPESPAPVVQPPRDWDVIRRLCSFQADVVQEIQSSKIEFATHDDALDAILRAPVDWFALSRGATRIHRDSLPNSFDTTAQHRATFCGPMHLLRRRSRKGDELIWLPIFLVHAATRRYQVEIGFQLDGEVELNMAWVQEVFASEDEGVLEDTLIRLGMLREDEFGGLCHCPVWNFAECWLALKANVPEFAWVVDRDLRTPGGPAHLKEERREGVHPHVVLLREELSPYNKGLILDLRAVAQSTDEEIASSALSTLLSGHFAGPGPLYTPREQVTLVEHSPLNPSQAEAVVEAYRAPLTVIQGPPGTGKSTVVRSTLLTLGVHGQTALFGSTNHKAVDAVIGAMNRREGVGPLVADLRTREGAGRWTRQLLLNVAGSRAADDFDLEAFLASLAEIEDAVSRLLAGTRRALLDGDRLLELEQRLRALAADYPQWVDGLSRLSLPFAVAEGTGTPAQREAAFRSWWRSLSARIRFWRHLLAIRLAWPDADHPPWRALPRLLAGKIDQLAFAAVEAKLRASRSLDEQTDALLELVEAKADAVEEALMRLPAAWASCVRKQVDALSEIRRESSGGGHAALVRRSEVERRHFKRLLPGLPLWAVTNLSVPLAVPREAAAFDLAIIDEAGQCNPASVLPLLFRAKRALFVGDPQQLRPVGSLAQHKEDILRRRYGFEGSAFSRFAFSGRSAYDLAHDALIQRGGHVILLREHYRCHPAIAEFFNEHYYDGNLLVRTTGRSDMRGSQGITWTHVPGGSIAIGSSRWHPPQVEAIVTELNRLASRGFDGTVGVVTPFREHAKRVSDAAFSALGAAQADRWQFISETADGFQGGERDLILFGLVGGGEGKSATPPFYLRERNRFNVAVSRARIHLHVFGDELWARDCGVPVLASLLEASRTDQAPDIGPVRTDLIGPVWEPRLAEALSLVGIEFRQQYPTCGYYLDFAIFPADGRKVNIEVDGETYHRDRDGNLRAEDVRRDLVLRANGWTVLRFWVYQLREDWENCMRRIRTVAGTSASE